MDELTKLASEVRFRERFRGYDYDEVDAYVSSVSKAAVKVKERMAVLQQRAQRAEAAAAESRSAARSPEGQDRDDRRLHEQYEQLARALILAQRTADEVEARAETEAKSVVDAAHVRAEEIAGESERSARSRLREAEKQAALVVAEAESDAHRIIDDVKRAASEKAVTARASALREVRVLTKAKADLAREIVVLESQRDDQRRQLRLLWRSLCSFVAEIGLDGETDALDAEPESCPPQVVVDGSAGVMETVDLADGPADVESTGGDARHHESPSPALPSVSASHSETPTGETAPSALGLQAVESVPSASDESELEMPVSPISGFGAAGSAPDESTPDMPMPTWRDDVSGSTQSMRSSPFRAVPEKSIAGNESAPLGESASVAIPDRAASCAASQGNGAALPSTSADVAAVRRLDDEPGHLADTAPEVAENAQALRLESVEAHGVGKGGVFTDGVASVADESDQRDEFVEQLRQVVSGDEPPPEPHDPMAAFFDHHEPVSRRRWRRSHR